MLRALKNSLAFRQFQQGHTLLNATARNAEEIPAIRFSKPAIALGNIGGNRKCGPIQLIGQKEVTSRKFAS